MTVTEWILHICFSDEEYTSWSERYHAATVSMDDREADIEAASDELEWDLRLLGATAIEDRLQDGVPETIADLKRAGIKVWVATGDKLETAIGENLFFSSNQRSYLIMVRSSHRAQYEFNRQGVKHDCDSQRQRRMPTCLSTDDRCYGEVLSRE